MLYIATKMYRFLQKLMLTCRNRRESLLPAVREGQRGGGGGTESGLKTMV